MKAKEFITEKNSKGTIGSLRQQATRGLHKFRDGDKSNTVYELNRVMMAVACSDGKSFPNNDSESWVGTAAVSAPYSKEEHDMLKLAYQAMGSDYYDLNHGDLESQELKDTNTHSPISSFKGYEK